jgi:rod shape determining protein RodA
MFIRVQKIFIGLKLVPWFMVLIITLISSIGFVLMYDAASGSMEPWASKQISFFLIFSTLMLAIGLVELKIIYQFAYVFYGITLLLLILVEIFGHNAMGATRWVNLGFMKLQPAEPMKLAIILALARYFHALSYQDILQIRSLIIPIIMLLAPALLIIKQPDLGTGIITLMVGAIMFFIAGVRMWKFVLSFVVVLGSLPITWHYLYDYQKQRILIFFDPESDPLGDGYNIIQSKIAIGSGGLFGKGMMFGSQAQLQFLPEHQTDFIFPMFAEEFGFVGALLIIFLYFILIVYGTGIALNCKSHFGKLLAYGVVSMFSVHVFINMGMVMGLLPVVGVPLPLLSYGGTIMATILIAFGLLINVHLNSRTALSQSSFGVI